MNKIIVNQISDPNVQQPFLGPSVDFLQNATHEVLLAFGRAMVGNAYAANTVYVLYGCVLTGVSSGAGNYAITAGAIFYNGEVYLVPAVGTTAVGGGNTVYSALATTNPSPDPVTFSDGSSKNVHDVRKWVTSVSATGGGGTNAFSTWILQPFSGTKTALSFVNGYSAGAPVPSYRIDHLGNVKLSGKVTGGTNTSTQFSSLPAEARPTYDKVLLVFGETDGVVYQLFVAAGGGLIIETLGSAQIPNNKSFWLDGAAEWNIRD